MKVPRAGDCEKIMIIFDHQVLVNSLDIARNRKMMRKFVEYK